MTELHHYDCLIGRYWFQCRMTVFNPPKSDGTKWTLSRSDIARMLMDARNSGTVSNTDILHWMLRSRLVPSKSI